MLIASEELNRMSNSSLPMTSFSYTCIDGASGREETGRIEGLDHAEAVAALRARGLHPIEVRETKAVPATGTRPAIPVARRTGRLDRKGRTQFTRQLASLLRAGMPLLRALEVLARQAGRTRSAGLLLDLAQGVRGGASLSATMAGHPRSFSPAYVAMVRAGEAGGVLERVLERLGLFLEKSDRLRGRVKAAMVYPLMIALVAGGVVVALMVFVVPKFEAVFASLLKGQPLPGLTAAVLGVGKMLQAHAALAIGLSLALAAGWMAVSKLTAVRRAQDRWLLKLPAVGSLATKGAVAHLSRTLGTLLSAGVPILPALTITRETAGNLRIAEALALVHDRVQAGDSVSAPLSATRIFPELVPSMIEVGEETGTLPEMLGRVADAYEEEVDAAVAGFTSLIEPVTIAVMAVVVGTIVIAMFLPIVRIIQTLS